MTPTNAKAAASQCHFFEPKRSAFGFCRSRRITYAQKTTGTTMKQELDDDVHARGFGSRVPQV
jgi:hypothetical protein